MENKELDILKAAEHEFLTKGFSGARTVSIAESAGVTHAMLHYYFRTKEQLFQRILEEKIRLMGQWVLPVFEKTNRPIEDRIRETVELHFDFLMQNPELPRFLINEVLSHPDRYKKLQERLRTLAKRVIVQGQKELDGAAASGRIEQVDIRLLLLDIVSLNVFLFVAYPLMETVFGGGEPERERFLAARKKENVEIIMRRIKVKSK